MARLTTMACALTLLTLLAGGCDPTAIKVSDQDVVAVEYEGLGDLMSGAKGLTIIVDVRAPRDYEQGHIPGAINIFLPKIVAGDPQLGKAKNIVVYGSGWSEPLSSAAAKRLLAVGYSNVFDFRGGMEIWKSKGRKTDTGGGPATQP